MRVENWGQIDYEVALERQLAIVQEVAEGGGDERIVFCTHPPVVTLGRGSSEVDIQGWSGPVVRSNRGGRATYHGPNQLVIYPIFDLRVEDRPNMRVRDVGCFIRWLGQSMEKTLLRFGVKAEFRQGLEVDELGLKRQLTGVWVGAQKVASMGVAVKKWITHHGLAVNLDRDDRAFEGLRPCGFARSTMTNVEELLGSKVDREIFAEAFLEQSFRLLETNTTGSCLSPSRPVP